MIKKTKLPNHICNTVACMKRKSHHHLLHHIHKKHNISYKTLFYMKEYGPKSHVATVIIKESIKVLILASIISSIGGIHIRSVQDSLITILPLLILLPALNDMIGDFGAIVSSKFTTMLYLKKVQKKWRRSKPLKELILTVFLVALIVGVYVSILAVAFAMAKGFEFSAFIFVKILAVTLISVAILITIIIGVSIIGGIFIYKRKEDPNNFLIPISTSIADFGSMLILALFVSMLF